ncbi:MAG: terminase small subunit [Nitrospira sp.]
MKKPSRKAKQTKAARNLAKGMDAKTALIEAGYSESYAKARGYTVVKRPYIQTILTESCDRIMKRRDLVLDDILEPVFEALSAKVIVRSQQLGDAQEVDLPDHQIRMQASDRLVDLYSGQMKDKHEEEGLADLIEELVKLSRTDACR